MYSKIEYLNPLSRVLEMIEVCNTHTGVMTRAMARVHAIELVQLANAARDRGDVAAWRSLSAQALKLLEAHASA